MEIGSIDLLPVGKQLLARIQKDHVSDVAAELAYWFFLAIFPFLIFVAALSSFLVAALGIPSATGEIIATLEQVMPNSAAVLIGPQIAAVIRSQNAGLLSVGIVGTIWASSGGINGVIRATNAAYEVDETRSFLQVRGLAVGLTILGGVMVVLAFALFVLGELIGSRFAAAIGLAGPFPVLLGVVYFVGAVVLVFLATAFLYWKAPNVQVPFRWTLPGALFFSVAWSIATRLVAFYVSHFGSYNATYGALGGLAIALLWFYVTGFILIVGAEINAIVDEQTHHGLLHKTEVESESRPQQKGA